MWFSWLVLHFSVLKSSHQPQSTKGFKISYTQMIKVALTILYHYLYL